MRYILLLVVSATALADQAGDLNRPALTQDLADPPRMEICMRDLLNAAVPGLNVDRFMGPHIVPTQKDRLYYRVTTESREKYRWYFTTGDGNRWRYFSYEGPTGGKTGAFANSLKRESELTSTLLLKVVAKPDLTPCAKHLGY